MGVRVAMPLTARTLSPLRNRHAMAQRSRNVYKRCESGHACSAGQLLATSSAADWPGDHWRILPQFLPTRIVALS